MIEPEHLQALFDENEITIAEAEAAGSRSTAGAYAAQQETIRNFNRRPAETFDAPLEDAPDKTVNIQGFDFRACSADGCNNMAPCPLHQHHAWQRAVNQQWGNHGSKRLG